MSRVTVDFSAHVRDFDWFADRLGLDGARIIGERDVLHRCPAHDDFMPSLHIWEDGHGLGVHCFAGCSRAEIEDALEAATPRRTVPKLVAAARDRGRVVATYDYTDPVGNLLYRKRRFEPKEFDFQRPLIVPARTGRPVQHEAYLSWQPGLKDREGNFLVEPVPYNQHGLLHSRHPWIVDGEKDADRLAEEGIVATCSPYGMARWHDDWLFIPGEVGGVTIVADRDEPGYRAASDLAQRLRSLGLHSVRVVEARSGKDSFDHLEAGLGVDEFHVIEGG